LAEKLGFVDTSWYSSSGDADMMARGRAIRYAVLACIRISRNARFNHPPESLHLPEIAATPFLNRIAALPDELIRDFVVPFVGDGFEFNDAKIKRLQRNIKKKEDGMKRTAAEIDELKLEISRIDMRNW